MSKPDSHPSPLLDRITAPAPETAWSSDKDGARAALHTLDHALAILHSTPTLTKDLAATLRQAQEAAGELRRILGLTPPSLGRVLFVDDNAPRAKEWTTAFQAAGFSIALCETALAARAQAQAWTPHLILLSLGIAQQDNSLFPDLQATKCVIVVLMGRASLRVATSQIQDADDYFPDVLPLRLAVERAHALIHRTPDDETRIVLGPLRIDLTTQTVTLDEKPIRLTPIEYGLLVCLANQPGKILTHDQLLHRVWGPAYSGQNDYLWVHLSRLRRKLALPGRQSMIITERGVGYRLRWAGY